MEWFFNKKEKDMLKFFDYCYYCFCKFYNKSGDSQGFRISALALLTAIQIINLFTVFGVFFQLFNNFYPNINKFFYIIPGIILLIVNGFRYNKVDYEALTEKWKNEIQPTRLRRGNIVLLYVIFSLITVVVLIIWRANTK